MDPKGMEPSSRPRAQPFLAWTLVAAGYSLLTLIYLRPVWRTWGDRIPHSADDPLLVLYILKWTSRQIALGLPDLWNANLFHPTPGALTLSEHLLGPAAQLYLLLKVFPNAIAGYNFLFFTSFVATALTVCWMMRRAGLSWTAALLAGWMYSFSSFRLAQMSHLQMLIAQWIPLTLWFWDRLLAERTIKNASLFLLFYLLHVTGGCYLAYMIHFPLLVLLVHRLTIEKRELLSLRALRLLVPVGMLAAAALLAIFLPYARTSRSLGLVRMEEEVRDYGATPASYLTPARANLYMGAGTKDFLRSRLGISSRELLRPERSLFAGILPTLLFVVGAIVQWRRRRRGPPDPWERGLALCGLVCFALTFPMFYEPLMRIVPGMSGMRVPARFYAFVSLALVHFAARGVDWLLEKAPATRPRAITTALLATVLVVEMAPRPLRWVWLPDEEDFPRVYHWISREPSVKALIELPIHRDARESRYLYYSTLHWKPLANGYSGYWPQSHEWLTARMRFLPDRSGLELLRDLRVTHLVVHARTRSRQGALEVWEEDFATGENRQVERVHRSGESSVYRLLDSSRKPKRAGR